MEETKQKQTEERTKQTKVNREGKRERERDGTGLSARDFMVFSKTFISLVQPSLCSNSRTHDLTIHESHDIRTTRR